MKTKLKLTTALILFISNLSGQEYHPFLNTSSWIVSDWVSCCRQPIVHTFETGIDSPVGEFNYKKINDPFNYSGVDTVYVREDVASKKVYRLVDGLDKLIYDFSLESGQTITLGDKTFAATVDEIQTQAGPRKRITLNTVVQYNGYTLTQVWIEGVGTVAHPFYPDCNMYNVMSTGGGMIYTTRCSFQNQEHIYGNPEQCGTAMSIADNSSGRKISIAPNPVISEITIATPFELQNATFKLFDIQGQLLKEVKNITGNTFSHPRENLGSGIYFVQLSDNGTLIFTDKIVVR